MHIAPSPPALLLKGEWSTTTPSSLTPPLPLERLRVPEAFDGRAGGNRAGPDVVCQLAASNDLEAIQAWLAEFHDS
ncbi:MAG: integrase, partial [Candidatus Competibacter phosphatis]